MKKAEIIKGLMILIGKIAQTMPQDQAITAILGMTKPELVEAIATNSKLTKADAGRAVNAAIAKLKVVFGG